MLLLANTVIKIVWNKRKEWLTMVVEVSDNNTCWEKRREEEDEGMAGSQ